MTTKIKCVCMAKAKEFKASKLETVIALLEEPGGYSVIQFVRLDGTVFTDAWSYYLDNSNGCFVISETF